MRSFALYQVHFCLGFGPAGQAWSTLLGCQWHTSFLSVCPTTHWNPFCALAFVKNYANHHIQKPHFHFYLLPTGWIIGRGLRELNHMQWFTPRMGTHLTFSLIFPTFLALTVQGWGSLYIAVFSLFKPQPLNLKFWVAGWDPTSFTGGRCLPSFYLV